MPRNRIEAEPVIRLPRPPEPPLAPTAFMAFPAALSAGVSSQQQLLYQYALEQARAAARPSLPERDLLGIWN